MQFWCALFLFRLMLFLLSFAGCCNAWVEAWSCSSYCSVSVYLLYDATMINSNSCDVNIGVINVNMVVNVTTIVDYCQYVIILMSMLFLYDCEM